MSIHDENRQVDLIMTYLAAAASLAVVFDWDADDTAQKTFLASEGMIQRKRKNQKASVSTN